MAREATAPELAYFRTAGQTSDLKIAIPATAVVFAAQINQTFTAAKSRDMVVQLTYDNVTAGAYGDIIPGMTVLIGSASGSSNTGDLGICRVRKAATSTKVYISETSDIWFNNDKFITIIQDYAPWAKHPRVTASVAKMDWDVAYSDQNTNFSPIAIWGSDRVGKLVAGTVSFVFDASGSYCHGSSISGYVFTCTGATVTNPTTATPTITITSNGTYTVFLSLTATNGKTSLSSRTIYVGAGVSVAINNFSGSLDGGGWSVGLTMMGNCDLTTIRPRAKIILYSNDYYGSANVSIGPIAGSENVKMIGWIAEEDFEIAPDASSVSFVAKTADYWIDQETSYPLGVENTTTTASAWTNIKDLTIDKMLVNTLIWRTTLTTIVDCHITGDTRKASRLTAEPGSIWQQLVSIAQPTILAKPGCDRYSRLYVEIETQYMNSKAAVPVVMTITKADRVARLSFGKIQTARTSQLKISGIYYNGSSAKALFSLSPGHTPKQYGTRRNQDYLLLTSSQTTTNELCGDVMGTDNNPFPRIPIELLQNNCMIDVVPHQLCYIDIPTTDNVRGVGYTGNLIPRSVEYVWDKGQLNPRIEFEAQCTREMARKGDIPINETDTIDIPEAPPLVVTPPIITPPTPPIPENPPIISRINRVIVRDYNKGIFYSDTVSDLSPLWLTANFGLPVSPTYIAGMLVTGMKNLVVSYGYLYIDEETYPQSGLWTAAPGGTFQKILSWADVATAIGATNDIKIWVAVSPFDDTIAVFAHDVGRFFGEGKIFVGTSAGGFVAGATNPYITETIWQYTSLSYGDGEWRFISDQSSIYDYSYLLRFSLDGSTITYNSGETFPTLPISSNPQSNFSTGGLFALPLLGKYSSDNGTTLAAFTATPASPQTGYAQALAGDPTKTVLMWASDAPLSLDGGATWNVFASFPGTPSEGSAFCYYPPPIAGLNEWLATVPNYGSPTQWIVHSVDNGSNWIDKTGNFLTIADTTTPALVEIYGI